MSITGAVFVFAAMPLALPLLALPLTLAFETGFALALCLGFLTVFFMHSP